MTLLHEIFDLGIECEKKPVLEEEEEEALTMKLSREVLQTVEQDLDCELRIPEFGCRDLKATRGDAQPWKKTLFFVERRPENRYGFCTIFIIPFDIAIASISTDKRRIPQTLPTPIRNGNAQKLSIPFFLYPTLLCQILPRNSTKIWSCSCGRTRGTRDKDLNDSISFCKVSWIIDRMQSIPSNSGSRSFLGFRKRGAEDGAMACRKP